MSLSINLTFAAASAGSHSRPTRRGVLPAPMRALLLAGCVASAAAVGWLADPAAVLQADPELARLLRGMALIKAAVVLAAIGVLLWRFGGPTTPRTASAYLAGAWMLCGASLLIWQLSAIAFAALLFHTGVLLLLVAAWRDRGALPARSAVRRSK